MFEEEEEGGSTVDRPYCFKIAFLISEGAAGRLAASEDVALVTFLVASLYLVYGSAELLSVFLSALLAAALYGLESTLLFARRELLRGVVLLFDMSTF